MIAQSSTATSPISPVYTALIAASAAIVGVVLKDFIFRIWERDRDKSANLDAIYSRYSEPLISASTSLMWRLKEIFDQPVRAGFLKVDVCELAANKYAVFANYKKLSTLYRLAVLLGWVRACRREFSSLRVADAKKAAPVELAFAKLESSLADGPQVELERLRELARVWNVQLPANDQQLSAIGIDIETTIDSVMISMGVNELSELSPDGQSRLLSAVAQAITQSISTQPIHQSVLAETTGLAMKIIGIREAWIYRDWQSSIGDLVLRRVDKSDRTFDVIGFSEFETFCTRGDEDQRKWIARLSAVFDDVDIASRDPYDHRYQQLQRLLIATADLTVALSTCVKDSNINAATILEAKRLASQLS